MEISGYILRVGFLCVYVCVFVCVCLYTHVSMLRTPLLL